MFHTPHKGISPRLLSGFWGDHPVEEWAKGVGGRFFFDDFLNCPKATAPASAMFGAGYAAYGDTGVVLQQKSDDIYGVLEISGNDADNDEGSITTGGNTGPLCELVDAGNCVVFECSIYKASIADNALAFFAGLSEPGLAAANTLIDDTGVLADKDFFGFQSVHADGDAINVVYRKAGQAIQTLISGVAVPVAGAKIKLGFVYWPKKFESSKICKFYVDGVEASTYLTQTQHDAATFPDGEDLAMLFATKVGAAAESKCGMDWWALGTSEVY